VYIPEERSVFTVDTVIWETMSAFHDASLDAWVESLEVLSKPYVRFVLPRHRKVCGRKYLHTQASIIRGRLEAEKKAKTESLAIEQVATPNIDPLNNICGTGIKPYSDPEIDTEFDIEIDVARMIYLFEIPLGLFIN
jgi:hypothetical protein